MLNNFSSREDLRDLFNKKNAIDKIHYFELINGEINVPEYPEGVTNLTIVKCKSEKLFGNKSDVTKIQIIFEDELGNPFSQIYFLKNGKNNNFGKFLYQALNSEPEEEFSLKELEGKKIIATVAHYYNEQGVGYANIAYCKAI